MNNDGRAFPLLSKLGRVVMASIKEEVITVLWIIVEPPPNPSSNQAILVIGRVLNFLSAKD